MVPILWVGHTATMALSAPAEGAAHDAAMLCATLCGARLGRPAWLRSVISKGCWGILGTRALAVDSGDPLAFGYRRRPVAQTKLGVSL